MASGRAVQRAAYILDVALVVLLVVVPTHAYEWMRDMDPTVDQLPEDPYRDVRLIGTLVPLLAVIGLHGLCIARDASARVRLKNTILAAGLALLWAWRFVL